MTNSISVAGIVGKDMELKTIGNEQVGNFSVADSQGKNKETIWFSCQIWGKRADILSNMIKKGTRVTVFGNLSTFEWTDKDGNKKTTLNVRVNDVAIHGNKEGSNESEPAQEKKQNQKSSNKSSDFDDDISF